MKKITVLIVDDHQLTRAGIKSLLSSTEDIDAVGAVGSGEEAIEFTRKYHPEVILMDLRMPGMGGLKATQEIVQHYPESRILVVSACDSEPYPSSALTAGATGFVSKSGGSSEELLAAIRDAANGIQYLSPTIAEVIALKKLSDNDSPFDILSDMELRVALLLIQGIKGKYIAEQMQMDAKLVSSYRSRIYNKLSIKTDVALALLAVRYGIVDDAAILNS